MWNIWNRCLTRHRHTTAHWTRHFPPPPPPPPPSPLALLPPQVSSIRASFLSLSQCWVSPLPLLFRQRDDDDEKTEHEKYIHQAVIHCQEKKTNTAALCQHTYDRRESQTNDGPQLETSDGARTRAYIYLCSLRISCTLDHGPEIVWQSPCSRTMAFVSH